MFCSLTQRGLQFDRYQILRWQDVSSKNDWPGPIPKKWNRIYELPEQVKCTNFIYVGWTHLSYCKFCASEKKTSFMYHVYAWGFPFPSMRLDEARGIDNFGTLNVVDSKMHRGYEFYLNPNAAMPMRVPLIPWWPGFILNTLLWSLALAWTAKTLQHARWFKRMQRGQCIKCKYQVGSLRTCPECGTEKPCP